MSARRDADQQKPRGLRRGTHESARERDALFAGGRIAIELHEECAKRAAPSGDSRRNAGARDSEAARGDAVQRQGLREAERRGERGEVVGGGRCGEEPRGVRGGEHAGTFACAAPWTRIIVVRVPSGDGT